MKTFKILLCGLFTIVVCQTRLDYNSEDCNHYLQKIIKQQKGIAPTSLSFTGDSALNSDQSSVIISLRYTDSLYNDEIYFGLTQEDGKTPEQTCLDLKLWKFTSTSYTDPVEVTDLPFTASTNLQKYWRYLSFTIKENELTTRLVQSSIIDYREIIIIQISQSLLMGSTVIVISLFTLDTILFPIMQLVQHNFNTHSIFNSQSLFPNQKKSQFQQLSGHLIYMNQKAVQVVAVLYCVHIFHFFHSIQIKIFIFSTIQPSSQLKWCKDVTCTDNSIPELHLYDQFYILQIVTASSLASYYLTDTVVELIGNGLNQQIIPVLTDNSKPGQVLILLTAEIVWVDFNIQVISYISTTQTGSRLLVQEDIAFFTIFLGFFFLQQKRQFKINPFKKDNLLPCTSENDSIRGRILTLDQIIFDPISGITAPIPCIDDPRGKLFFRHPSKICFKEDDYFIISLQSIYHVLN